MTASEAAIPAEIAARIEDAHGFVFDMDGTIALGDDASGGHVALPGAAALLDALRACGIPFCVLTNGSAKPPASYARALRAAGIDVRDQEMITPSSVAADYHLRQGLRRVRVLGTAGAAAPFHAAGLEVIEPSAPAAGVQSVYTGWFREFSFPDLEAGCRDLEDGALLTSASHVPFFATRNGRGIGTSFAINVMLHALTGKEAKVLGKPSPDAFHFAMRLMEVDEADAGRIVVVGDDPALEMAMARSAGAIGVGMTTGLNDRKAFERQNAARQADLVLDGLDPLLEIVRRKNVIV